MKFNLSQKKTRPRKGRIKKPSFRYQYALDLVDQQRLPTAEDDSAIHEIFNLLNITRYRPADEVEDYKDRHPDVADALMIYSQGPVFRSMIDYRIVAGYSYQEIADSCGYPVEVIQLYGACFFDIGDFKHCPGYLQQWAINPIKEAAPFSLECMIMTLACLGGKEFVEWSLTASPESVQKVMESLFDRLLLNKAIQAVNGLSPNQYNAVEVITAAAKVIEGKRKVEAFSPKDENSEYITGIASTMLKSMSYAFMTGSMPPVDPARAVGLLPTKDDEEVQSLLTKNAAPETPVEE